MSDAAVLGDGKVKRQRLWRYVGDRNLMLILSGERRLIACRLTVCRLTVCCLLSWG